jgi:ketosteroid isomerase-like protein
MKALSLVSTLIMVFSSGFGAELDPKIEAIHNELRALRAGVLEAINKGDLERQLTYLHTNVVVTWHNAEVSRGRDAVRSYYNRLTSGPNKMVDSFSADLNVDELTILHGENTGISFGSSIEHFKLSNGNNMDLKGRWTATLVKENGKWLIASLHVSTNLFDNVMLDMVKNRTKAAVIIALVTGAAVGWIISKGRKRARPAPPAA